MQRLFILFCDLKNHNICCVCKAKIILLMHSYPYLFGDVDRNAPNFDTSKKLIFQRVLEFGLMKDWKLINKMF